MQHLFRVNGTHSALCLSIGVQIHQEEMSSQLLGGKQSETYQRRARLSPYP